MELQNKRENTSWSIWTSLKILITFSTRKTFKAGFQANSV